MTTFDQSGPSIAGHVSDLNQSDSYLSVTYPPLIPLKLAMCRKGPITDLETGSRGQVPVSSDTASPVR